MARENHNFLINYHISQINLVYLLINYVYINELQSSVVHLGLSHFSGDELSLCRKN